MHNSKQSPVIVSIQHVSDQMRKMLMLFFQQLKGKGFDLAMQGDGHICIFDADTQQGRYLLTKAEKQTLPPVLIALSLSELSSPEEEATKIWHLKKPFRQNELLHFLLEARSSVLLTKVKLKEVSSQDSTPLANQRSVTTPVKNPNRLASKTCLTGMSKNDAEHKKPAKPRRIKITYWKPENHLLDAVNREIQLSAKSAQVVRIDFLRDSILVSHKDGYASLDIKLSRVKYYASIQIPPSSIRLKEISQTEFSREQLAHKESFEALRWKLSLWAARGRLMERVDVHKVVQLQQWPNLTRLQQSPHCVRIAALWAASPCSLQQTVELLNIPAQDVFDFYSAVSAVGLIKESELIEKEEPVKLKKKPLNSLFKSMLSHLQGFKKAEALGA